VFGVEEVAGDDEDSVTGVIIFFVGVDGVIFCQRVDGVIFNVIFDAIFDVGEKLLERTLQVLEGPLKYVNVSYVIDAHLYFFGGLFVGLFHFFGGCGLGFLGFLGLWLWFFWWRSTGWWKYFWWRSTGWWKYF
jgi:hypothetical protein